MWIFNINTALNAKNTLQLHRHYFRRKANSSTLSGFHSKYLECSTNTYLMLVLHSISDKSSTARRVSPYDKNSFDTWGLCKLNVQRIKWCVMFLVFTAPREKLKNTKNYRENLRTFLLYIRTFLLVRLFYKYMYVKLYYVFVLSLHIFKSE